MLYTKEQWLGIFRTQAKSIMMKLHNKHLTPKELASEINKQIKQYRDELLCKVKSQSTQWSNIQILNEIMTMTYASYVIMLEYRNLVWPYEYMTFSRRIGEFWEPFCKLAFYYPIKKLTIIEPPNFNTVQNDIKNCAIQYIKSLSLSETVKERLQELYKIPWEMVDSGGIKLELDLHFEQDCIHYNCDFKSGFSSNEKGNTNRLLLVASIYNSLGDNEKTVLFVRQKEDDNNHYLKTLKNSQYWQVYCAEECYSAIEGFKKLMTTF